MFLLHELVQGFQRGDNGALARCVSIAESGSVDILTFARKLATEFQTRGGENDC